MLLALLCMYLTAEQVLQPCYPFPLWRWLAIGLRSDAHESCGRPLGGNFDDRSEMCGDQGCGSDPCLAFWAWAVLGEGFLFAAKGHGGPSDQAMWILTLPSTEVGRWLAVVGV